VPERASAARAENEPPSRTTQRAPRAEGGEQVAEQRARERQPDPEDDEDEAGREVVERALGAGEAGDQYHCKEHDADRPAGDLEEAGSQHPPERPGQGPPMIMLQLRLGPERGEGEERDDQDDGGGPEEKLLRDREVGALDEPVSELHRGGSAPDREEDSVALRAPELDAGLAAVIAAAVAARLVVCPEVAARVPARGPAAKLVRLDVEALAALLEHAAIPRRDRRPCRRGSEGDGHRERGRDDDENARN
jgi:hypothetical protein